MYCPFCAANIPAAAQFCVSCGRKVPIASSGRIHPLNVSGRRNRNGPVAAQESVVLGRDLTTGEPVSLAADSRLQGTYVIGKQGMGKTNFLLNLMLQDAEHGHGLCFLDPHGDATDDLLAHLPEHRLKDVVLLDAGNRDCAFGVNFFELPPNAEEEDAAKRAEQAVGVFRKLWGQESWGPLLEDLLYTCSYTLIANPGYTMAEMQKLLVDAAFRARLVANVRHETVLDFWRHEYDPLRDKEQADHRRSTLNKVRRFILNPMVKRIVGQSHTTIDLRLFMDEGKIVLVKLPLPILGDAPVNLIGSILVGMLLNSAFERGENRERRTFFLYADEYHRFATEDFATLLTEARKYGIATTTAHQNRSQLHAIGRKVAEVSAANLVIFQVGGEDADELKSSFNAERQQEVVGDVPKKVLSQQPVEDLIHHPPANSAIEALVHTVLLPIVEGSTIRWPEGEHRAYTFDEDHYDVSPLALLTAVRQLNPFLRRMMHGRILAQSEQEARGVADLLDSLRAYNGLISEFDVVEIRPPTFPSGEGQWEWIERPLTEDQREALRAMVHVLTYSAADTSVLEILFLIVRRAKDARDLFREIERHIAYDMQASVFEVARRGRFFPDPNHDHYRLSQEEWSQSHDLWRGMTREEQNALVTPKAQKVLQTVEAARQKEPIDVIEKFQLSFLRAEQHEYLGLWFSRFIRTTKDLLALGRLLQSEPIFVNSTDTEPQYRDRPIADIRNELANTLANLPKFQAYCKLLGGDRPHESTITPAPLPPGPSQEVHLPRLLVAQRQAGENGYCRTREEIDAEISARTQRAGPVSEDPERWGEE
jgi:hypothetical protein